MEILVISRVKELLEHEKMSVNSFSKAVGMNQVTVNNYIIGNRKLSFELIDAMLTAFPTLSAEWLLRGIGQMYKEDDKISAPVVCGDKDALICALQARIAEQENYISDLRSMLNLNK